MDVDDAGESFRRDDIPLLWIPSCHRAGTGKKVGHVCAPNQWWEVSRDSGGFTMYGLWQER